MICCFVSLIVSSYSRQYDKQLATERRGIQCKMGAQQTKDVKPAADKASGKTVTKAKLKDGRLISPPIGNIFTEHNGKCASDVGLFYRAHTPSYEVCN